MTGETQYCCCCCCYTPYGSQWTESERERENLPMCCSSSPSSLSLSVLRWDPARADCSQDLRSPQLNTTHRRISARTDAIPFQRLYIIYIYVKGVEKRNSAKVDGRNFWSCQSLYIVVIQEREKSGSTPTCVLSLNST